MNKREQFIEAHAKKVKRYFEAAHYPDLDDFKCLVSDIVTKYERIT